MTDTSFTTSQVHAGQSPAIRTTVVFAGKPQTFTQSDNSDCIYINGGCRFIGPAEMAKVLAAMTARGAEITTERGWQWN